MAKLYVVATPIGNLGDMGARAINVLTSVDFIAAEDTRVTKALLNALNIAPKGMISLHKFSEQARANEVVDTLLAGKDVALVTDAGTPAISDPGSFLVRLCHEQGIEVVAVAGASALVSALSVSGIMSQSFAFLGFFPRDNKPQKQLVQKIMDMDVQAFVIYESPMRILHTMQVLCEHFSVWNVCVCNDLTKLFEKNYVGTVQEVLHMLEQNKNVQKGEYVIVLEKGQVQEIEQQPLCLEAQILQEMLQNKVSASQAVNALAQKKIAAKNELYAASLNLKEQCSKLF